MCVRYACISVCKNVCKKARTCISSVKNSLSSILRPLDEAERRFGLAGGSERHAREGCAGVDVGCECELKQKHDGHDHRSSSVPITHLQAREHNNDCIQTVHKTY